MRSCMFSLQKAIFKVLNEDTVLKKKLKGVYDYIDENSKFPIVTIGECYANDYSTDSFNGEDISQEIHIWSKYKGKKECKELASLVLEVIFRDLRELEDDFEIDIMRRESLEIFDDPDVDIKHGVIKLQFVVRDIR